MRERFVTSAFQAFRAWPGLDAAPHNCHVWRMKTLTMNQFFESPSLAKSLEPGQSLMVTAAGKPELIVTKAARRPKTTALQLRREAKALLSKPGKKVDTVVLLRELRK